MKIQDRHNAPPKKSASKSDLMSGIMEHARLAIVPEPTLVHRLESLEQLWNHPHLSVKREDFTSQGSYSGNKVRNLEYILADALEKSARRLITIAPLGSNFIAALAAHVAMIEADLQVYHFVPQVSPQIVAHASLTEQAGATLRIYDNGVIPRVMSIPAATAAAYAMLQKDTYFVSPGGSNVLGALGHVGAFFEFLDQVSRGLAVMPDTIVLGAGTCGTMAGLLAGSIVKNIPVRIIGVRCVDAVICNRFQIARLCNQVLKKMGYRRQVSAADVDLRVPAGPASRYGALHHASAEMIHLFREAEDIRLDTTYTSKVASFLRQYVAQDFAKRERILYWHTYSGLTWTPKAFPKT